MLLLVGWSRAGHIGVLVSTTEEGSQVPCPERIQRVNRPFANAALRHKRRLRAYHAGRRVARTMREIL